MTAKIILLWIWNIPTFHHPLSSSCQPLEPLTWVVCFGGTSVHTAGPYTQRGNSELPHFARVTVGLLYMGGATSCVIPFPPHFRAGKRQGIVDGGVTTSILVGQFSHTGRHLTTSRYCTLKEWVLLHIHWNYSHNRNQCGSHQEDKNRNSIGPSYITHR